MSNSLQSHGLQNARLPCPSPSPGACSNLCPLSWWCHPTLLSSIILFSSCLQTFPALRSFLMSWLFASGGQVLELQHQSFQWCFRTDFLKDWLVWSPCSPSNSQILQHHSSKSISSLVLSLLYVPALPSIHDYWKNHSFDYTEVCQQSDVSAFNTLSRFVIAFLPRSKHLLISWL